MNLRKHLSVIGWLAFVATCVLVISRSQFTADMSAFMPRNPTPTQKIMVEQLRDGVVSRLILIGVEGAPAPVLAQQRYVARIEHYCRIAPYNWFNFYDFWKP